MKLLPLIFIVLISCERKVNTEVNINIVEENQIICDSLFKSVLVGDFNGDNLQDTLNEFLISSINHKSIDVIPKIEYDSLVNYIHKLEPSLSFQSSNKKIPNLNLTKTASFGVFYAKNEGDLNGDGCDEISVVVDWADWSQCNSCQIYSLKKNEWIQIGQFDVREWQLERDSDFNGFIVKNEKGENFALTFDSEVNEIKLPLKLFLSSN